MGLQKILSAGRGYLHTSIEKPTALLQKFDVTVDLDLIKEIYIPLDNPPLKHFRLDVTKATPSP